MKKESINLEYLQPMVKVMTVTARQVLCQSPGTTQYAVDDEETINE